MPVYSNFVSNACTTRVEVALVFKNCSVEKNRKLCLLPYSAMFRPRSKLQAPFNAFSPQGEEVQKGI